MLRLAWLVALLLVVVSVLSPVVAHANFLESLGLDSLSPSDDMQLGFSATQDDIAAGRVSAAWRDSAGRQAVVRIMQRLVSARDAANPHNWRASVPGGDWRWSLFIAADTRNLDAHTMGGGVVVVTTALLYALPDEDAVAAVLGHEMAHCDCRHLAQRLGTATSLGAVSQLVGGHNENTTALKNLIATLLAKGRGRKHEEDADKIGQRYAFRAGFDPMGAVRAMQVLEKLGIGGAFDPFDEHPKTHDRVAYLAAEARKLNYGGDVHPKTFALLADLPSEPTGAPGQVTALTWAGGVAVLRPELLR
jgi:predicted Zn-dependent protease